MLVVVGLVVAAVVAAALGYEAAAAVIEAFVPGAKNAAWFAGAGWVVAYDIRAVEESLNGADVVDTVVEMPYAVLVDSDSQLVAEIVPFAVADDN